MKPGILNRIDDVEKAVQSLPDESIEEKMERYAAIFRDGDAAGLDEVKQIYEECGLMEKYEALFDQPEEQPVDKTVSPLAGMHQTYDPITEKKPRKIASDELSQPVMIDNRAVEKPTELKETLEPELIPGPSDGWLRRDPFKKELAQDGEGNWYWRTVVNLEECEIPPTVDDPVYLRALESCIR